MTPDQLMVRMLLPPERVMREVTHGQGRIRFWRWRRRPAATRRHGVGEELRPATAER